MISNKPFHRFLERLESCFDVPYTDIAGYPTIGIGHKLSQDEYMSGKIIINGKKYDWRNKPLTSNEIIEILEYDIDRITSGINKLFDITRLFYFQQHALISFVFNIGLGSFKESTLLKKLDASVFSQAPEQFKRWKYVHINGVKVESKGLINRRKYECALWENGKYDI